MFFKLYANCQVVKGATRSVICDLQRQEVIFIPNEVAELLGLLDLSVEAIKGHYKHRYDDIIDENFAWLEKRELGFFTQRPEFFKPLDLQWHEPYPVNNAIVDYDQSSDFELLDVLQELASLPCRHVQLRFWKAVSRSFIEDIMEKTEARMLPLEGIHLLLPYASDWEKEQLEGILKKPRMAQLVIYGAPQAEILLNQRPNNSGHVQYIKESIAGASSCGEVFATAFSCNMSMFTESTQFNSCLNRKIGIDARGNIKNCPSMQQNYGNIADTSLQKALAHPEFKKLWGITKDQVHVCRDCEFRYICTDCRAYVEDPKDIYSKPLKCGYNPYTAEWSDWAEDEKKQEVLGEYYLKKA